MHGCIWTFLALVFVFQEISEQFTSLNVVALLYCIFGDLAAPACIFYLCKANVR